MNQKDGIAVSTGTPSLIKDLMASILPSFAAWINLIRREGEVISAIFDI